MVTISTSSPPEARQTSLSVTLTTTPTNILDVPDYSVVSVVTNTPVIVGGVAEIVSSLILSNTSATMAYVTVSKKVGSATFSLATNVIIPPNDVVAIPLQGQFFMTGEELLLSATTASVIHATLSYTLGALESNDIV